MSDTRSLQAMSGATAAAGYVALVQLIGVEQMPLTRMVALCGLAFALPVLTYYYIHPLPIGPAAKRSRAPVGLFVASLVATVVALALLLFALHPAISASFLAALLCLLLIFRSQ